MIGIIIGNIFVIASLFLCSGGVLHYLIKIFQDFKRKNINSAFFYLIYFISSLILALGYLLAFNLYLLWGENPSNQNMTLYVNVVRTINSATLMSYLMLGIVLLLEFARENSRLNLIWVALLLSGGVIFILTLLVKVEIAGVENNFGIVNYNPQLIVSLSILYPFIIGIVYGIHIVRDYLNNYRTNYVFNLYHYSFIFVSFIAFTIIIFGILIRLVFPLPADIRALVFVIVTMNLLLFPSLRWIYIEQYEQQKMKFEKEKLQDMINHNLSNISQVILSSLEFSKMKKTNDVDIDSLMNQVMKMNELIDKSRETYEF